MLIDLHMHTTRYSPCAVASPDEMLEAAAAVRLDGVVITEHNTLWEPGEMSELRQKHPGIKIFNALEVTVEEKEDLLVYGVLEPDAFYRGMPFVRVVETAHKYGGAVVIAHPYRYRNEVAREIYRCRIDGIEVMSNNIYGFMKDRIEGLRKELDLTPVAGSDGHNTGALGIFAADFNYSIQNESELAEAIRAGEFKIYRNQQKIDTINSGLDEKITLVRKYIGEGLTNTEIKRLCGVSNTFCNGVMEGKDLRY